MSMNALRALLFASLTLFCTALLAQSDSDEELSTRSADIWSEGVRLSATVYRPAARPDEEPLPTILMAHGWGGEAFQLARDAAGFARAGYMAVTFDYRGWGESDGRLIIAEPGRALSEDRQPVFTAEVRELRELVDPVDMLADWQNALHWLHGEPGVDTSRIGLWGSSQSGGYVVEMALRDARVRAVHSQVPSLSGQSIGDTEEAREEATERARGNLPYPEAGARVVGNLRGAPIADRFANYSPVDEIHRLDAVAVQFVLAEDEELFDNREHGILAHERHPGPGRLIIIPDIAHYGIYTSAWQESHDLAVEWFDEHLRGQ